MAAQWPTPGDRREDHAVAAGDAIRLIYEAAELQVIAAIASAARKVATGAMLPKIAVRHIRQTAAAVFSRAAPQARKVLDEAMTTAQDQVRDMIPPVPAEASESARVMPISGKPVQDLAALLDTATDYAEQDAANQVTSITAAARLVTAQALPSAPPSSPYTTARDKALGQFSGWPGQSLSYRRIQAAQVMLDDLADQGITGFTDRAGRQWDLATYAEMATRTAVANAWDDMQAGYAVRAGLDLVETATWSTEGTCPLCLPWLGQTLSITGATKGYRTIADAKAAAWRHPNCRCSWTVIGGGYAEDVTNPVPLEAAAAVYQRSQKRRAHERKVRIAARRAQAAVTPQAKARVRRDLASVRAAAAAHRQQHQLRIMQVTSKRRERPHGPR